MDQRITDPLLRETTIASVQNGKLFRAGLVFTSCQMLGVSYQAGFPLAGAVELIHAYSLIHDDLPCMDDAAIRRGQATMHRRYGEATAILVGDALLTEAFALCSELDAAPKQVLGAIRSLANAAGAQGMVAGQLGDILRLPKTQDIDEVRDIHRQKTGALIHWSLVSPYEVWYPGHVNVLSIDAYAKHLGVLYQVRDDLLDVLQTAADDKDRAADGQKSTYAKLLGQKAAIAAAEGEMQQCLSFAACFPQPHSERLSTLAHWVAGRDH